MKPIVIDLYCGLGGWADGFLSEGYQVFGFDIERHDYGTGGYPGQLILQDVLTLHGFQFKDATVIVASPPCQAYSYRAMPWKRAKALPPPDNSLFEACFRIQQEACEAAGHHIPLIVENVRGAVRWVSQPVAWHFGSFYLWGDVPALMPITLGRSVMKAGVTHRSDGTTNFHGMKNDGSGWRPNGTLRSCNRMVPDGLKGKGSWFGDYQAQKIAQDARGLKQGGDWFGKGEACSMSRRYSSKSAKRKAASAQIAKIPFPLAQHIARCFK